MTLSGSTLRRPARSDTRRDDFGRARGLLLLARGSPERHVAGRRPTHLPRSGFIRSRSGRSTSAPLHAVVREHLDLAVPRPLLAEVHQASGGNPFFALEIARTLKRGDAIVEAGSRCRYPSRSTSSSRQDSRRSRPRAVTFCSPRQRTLIRRRRSWRRPPESIDRWVSFRDPGRHRRSRPRPDPLHSPPAGAGCVQRRRLRASQGDPRTAGGAARGSGGPRVAARRLGRRTGRVGRRCARGCGRLRAHTWSPATCGPPPDRARQLTPPDRRPDEVRRAVEAAFLHFEAGDPRRAEAQLREVIAPLEPGPERARALVVLARIRLYEAPDEAGALFEQVVDLAGADRQTLALAHEGVAACSVWRFERFDDAIRHADIALSLAGEMGDLALAGDVQLVRLSAEALLGRQRRPRRQRRRSPSRQRRQAFVFSTSRSARSRSTGPGSMHMTRRVPLSRTSCAASTSWVTRARGPGSSSSSATSSCWSATSRRVSRAREAGGRRADGLPCSDCAHARSRVSLRHNAAGLKPPGRLRGGHRDPLDPVCGPRRIRGSGTPRPLARAAERRRRAPGVADRGRTAEGIVEPGATRFVVDHVEALVEPDVPSRRASSWTGTKGNARRLARVSALANCARCRGLLAAAGELDVALTAFAEALEPHAQVELPLDRGRTLLALGATQRRLKRRREARATLEEALAVFERIGAALWAERARAELKRISGRAASPGALTPAEERVAALVALGKTNKEVAAALFLSNRTVEGHLAHIFGKLGIRQRGEPRGRPQNRGSPRQTQVCTGFWDPSAS